MGVRENIAAIKKDIEGVCTASGRQSREVCLVLVTKNVGPEKIFEAYQEGVRDFGENRIQEWLTKAEALPKDIRWHFIGRLQNNKIKYLIRYALEAEVAPVLQSLDRPELAGEIENAAKAKGLTELGCLIQVNTTAEATKGGFRPDQVASFAENIKEGSILKIHGLMTIGPLSGEPKVREAFRQLKNLQDDLKTRLSQHDWETLSMGMSSDFKIAIEEGANIIRIGTAAFGERPK